MVFLLSFITIIVFGLIPIIFPKVNLKILLFSGIINGFIYGLFGGGEILGAIGGIYGNAFKLLIFLLSSILLIGFRKDLFRLWPKTFLHLLFILYTVLSLVFSADNVYGLRNIAKHFAPLVVVYLFYLYTYSDHDLRKCIKWFYWGGISTLLLSLFTIVIPIGASHKTGRFTLPYVNPSCFSFYMLLFAIHSIVSYSYERKKVDFLFFLLFSFLTILPMTRITIAAYFISLSLMLFLIIRVKLIAIFLFVFGLFSAFILIFNVEAIKNRTFYQPEKIKMSTVITDPEAVLNNLNMTGRSEIWNYALKKHFNKSPLVGSGIGSTQYLFQEKTSGGVMHSEYIRLLCELGLFGLLLYLGMLLFYWLQLLNIWYKATSTETKKTALTALLYLVAFAVTCITDNVFDYIFYFTLYIFAFVGFSFKSNELYWANKNSQSMNPTW